MAAIATLHTFGGTGFTGFTNPDGTLTEVGGAAVPSVPASTSSFWYDTALVEVDSATETKGSQCKITVVGGCESGSKVRAMVNLTDIDNYHFAEMHKGGVTVFADLADDIIRLGKRVAGVDEYITGDTPVAYRQNEVGHLRHYTFTTGDTLTLIKVLDQYIVKASLTDPIDSRHVDDLIIMTETDGTASAVSKKVGFQLVGSTHTNTISLFQGGLITTKWTAKTGSDSAAGCENAPYLTMKKLMENTAVGQIGFIKTGTYNEAIGAGLSSPFNSTTLANGLSWEDAPLFMPYGTNVVTQTSTNRLYEIKGSSTTKASYRYFYGYTMDGLDAATYILRLWGQQAGGSGHASKNCRWQRVAFRRSTTSNVFIGNPTFSGTPATADYEQFLHWIDCTTELCTRSHGGYVETGQNVLEYTQCLNNGVGSSSNDENGWKFSYGTGEGFGGVKMTRDNIIRFSLAQGNTGYGFLCYGGVDSTMHSNIAADSNNGTSPSAFSNDHIGIGVYKGAEATTIYNNVVYNILGHGLSVHNYGNSTAQRVNGAYFVNNTSYANTYNYSIHTGTDGGGYVEPTDLIWMNNTSYGSVGTNNSDFAYVVSGAFHSKTTEHGTYTVGVKTFTTNHAADTSSGTGAGQWLDNVGVTGDPLYDGVDRDFIPNSASSPLVGAGTDPITYHARRDWSRRVQQSDGPVIGAFHFPDPFVTAPVVTMDPAKSLTIDVAGTVSCVITDADDTGGTMVVQVTITGDMVVTKPTASGATVRGFN